MKMTPKLQRDRMLVANRFPSGALCAVAALSVSCALFLTPRIEGVYRRMGIAPPLPARVLIGVNHYLD